MKRIMTILKWPEKILYIWVSNRFTGLIFNQVLLRHIRNIKTVVVLCQKMIIRLLFMRSTVFRYRFIPLVSIAKFRVNVKNNTPKRMLFMPDYLSEMIFCAFSKHCVNSVNCSFQNCLGQHYLKVYKFQIIFQINFLRL